MIELRKTVEQKLTEEVINKIANAPKPTTTAEVVAVCKQLEGMALSLQEIAQIINIAEPNRDTKATADDYTISELEKHPNLLVVRTPLETAVRYVPKITD